MYPWIFNKNIDIGVQLIKILKSKGISIILDFYSFSAIFLRKNITGFHLIYISLNIFYRYLTIILVLFLCLNVIGQEKRSHISPHWFFITLNSHKFTFDSLRNITQEESSIFSFLWFFISIVSHKLKYSFTIIFFLHLIGSSERDSGSFSGIGECCSSQGIGDTYQRKMGEIIIPLILYLNLHCLLMKFQTQKISHKNFIYLKKRT